MKKLNINMSVEEFEKGYFYATELKAFAKQLGIDVGTLRKNEVEEHIKAYLLSMDILIDPLLDINFDPY